MLIRVADLFVEIPATGGMASRCREYLSNENVKADITVCEKEYNPDRWPGASLDGAAYMDSGFLFYRDLLAFNGMMLHASAIELDGKAYLFSAPSGTGKSTHARLWQEVFGDRARLFNDDKPALRLIDSTWFAYGTPWCGKDGININMKAPLAGICFLKQGQQNVIRRLSGGDAITSVISQTLRKFKDPKNKERMLELVGRLISDVPIFELYNRPEPEAARLSYETMREGAKEAQL